MNKTSKDFLIETDILLEHLTKDNDGSLSELELAMRKGICFTTVINSSEVYFAVENKLEKEAADSLLRAVKVLGLNSRYSLFVNQFRKKVDSVRDAVICTVAKTNKLVILTNKKEKYLNSGLEVIIPKELRG